jgi:hypothetical protein
MMTNKQEDPSTARVQGGEIYVGNQQYKGLGNVRWCALCNTHRPQLGGTIRNIFGGRHWVCLKHKKV